MKSVIVGTAGHIDHGKTALVRALTGIDTDRLQEEKRRGITIDIGFANLDLLAPDGEQLRLGFVDVPGHERFLRNMLAGVGGIDLLLFVIAADESIKPQTREHFDICRMLGIGRGITVLTKSDTVDAETLDVVRLEVEEFLRGSFLDASHSPIIAVSSLSGAGIPALKQALAGSAVEVTAKDSTAIARLPIDRVFTMKGFGTVVTGTLVAGTIRKEDELEVFPTDGRVRVRGIQVHGAAAEQALAGQRTALNLAGVTVEDLARGMTLAPPDTFRSTKRLDVTLSMLPGAKPLKHRARVHLHAYTSETIAEVSLYEENTVKPGTNALAQLRLSENVLLLPGDRFILRQFSPVVTIGGGAVFDAAPRSRAKRDAVLPFLKVLAEGRRDTILLARIARLGHEGLTSAQLTAETGWPTQVLDRLVTDALQQKQILRVGERYVHSPSVEALQLSTLSGLETFHKENRLVPGMGKEELRETVQASPEIFASVIDALVNEKRIEIAGELLRLPGRGVAMKDEEAESKAIIEQAFASAGLQVPALHNVLGGLKIDQARAHKIVTLLLRDKVLVKVSEELVFHQSALAELRKQLAVYKAKSAAAGVARIDVGKFKELTGVSRKYAIPLLEYLDRERVTRRVADARVIL